MCNKACRLRSLVSLTPMTGLLPVFLVMGLLCPNVIYGADSFQFSGRIFQEGNVTIPEEKLHALHHCFRASFSKAGKIHEEAKRSLDQNASGMAWFRAMGKTGRQIGFGVSRWSSVNMGGLCMHVARGAKDILNKWHPSLECEFIRIAQGKKEHYLVRTKAGNILDLQGGTGHSISGRNWKVSLPRLYGNDYLTMYGWLKEFIFKWRDFMSIREPVRALTEKHPSLYRPVAQTVCALRSKEFTAASGSGLSRSHPDMRPSVTVDKDMASPWIVARTLEAFQTMWPKVKQGKLVLS